jgi:hypothetical protein
MKATKIMIVCIVVYLLTILLSGLLVYLVAGFLTYRDAILNGPFAAAMFALGWIPATIVGVDYSEYLDGK